MGESIRLDISNLTADKVGEHGVSAAELAALDERVADLRAIVEEERCWWAHYYLSSASAASELETVLRIAQPRMGRFAHLVLLGIGGSALGLKMLAQSLGYLDTSMPELHVVDNTDPALLARVQARIDLKQTLFVAVSKSGGTLETVLALGHFVRLLQQAGLDLADHVLTVTDPKLGPLREFTQRHGLESADIHSAIGGRFSVLTPAGTLPAALLNLDVASLLQGADRMAGVCAEGEPAQLWPARLGVLAADLCLKRGKTGIVFMPYSSRLEYLSDWFVQLWDESLGKDGKGQTAIRAAGATDQHAQVQLFMEGPNDKLLVFVRIEKHEPDVAIGDFEWDLFGCPYVKGRTLGQVINAQQAGTAQAATERGRPNATLVLPRLDADTVGELIMGLMAATTYASKVLGVNAYDQPSVELGKRISRQMLGGA
ncbi:MAG: glucose-6-phosphate isomerase [Planctomycetes bacterium]|nr:glucose-6-phosphate isomerase [Planctomycetota bacterium]